MVVNTHDTHHPRPKPQASIPPLLMWTAGRYSKNRKR